MADEEETSPKVEELEDDPPEEGAPAWVATFGDMMSLLLCFFVLMFSMSEIKVEKFLIAADSLRNGLGHGSSKMLASAGMGGESAVNTDVMDSDPAAYDITIAMEDVDDFLEFIAKTLEGFVNQQGIGDSVEVEQGEEGVSLSIQELVLFDVGSSVPRVEGVKILKDLGRVVSGVQMPLVVAGHTDDKPISTRVFPSNWELSAARAATVARIIVKEGLDPANVHIEGYAEFRPKDDNDSAVGRAKNRRVEILYTRDNVISQLVKQKERTNAQRVRKQQELSEAMNAAERLVGKSPLAPIDYPIPTEEELREDDLNFNPDPP